MTNLDSMLKSRAITLPIKVHLVKTMTLSSSHVWMWEFNYKESWVLKNCLLLRCWRSLLRIPWTARRYNQSILKEISPEYSLEGLMLKLKLQYFGHLVWRTDSFEKTLMLGKIEGGRKGGQHRMRWLDVITNVMDMCLSRLQELVIEKEAWRATVHGVTEWHMTEWTGLNWYLPNIYRHVQSLNHVWLCDPINSSLPGSSVHEFFSNKNTGLVCYFFLQRNFLTLGLKPCFLHSHIHTNTHILECTYNCFC